MGGIGGAGTAIDAILNLDFLISWLGITVSLFNVILLLWLGLTVLLNAERRTLGVWMAGGGLLLGAAFFVSHSIILGYGINTVAWSTDFWWHFGWIPAIGAPFAWYMAVLWYAGFWDDRSGAIYRRQVAPLGATVTLGLVLVGLLLFANPLPSYGQVARFDLSATPAIAGVPVLILLYPLFIVMCIGLALDALRRPGPSGRVMGDLARRRARPWLVATSLALMLVSLLVAGVIAWLLLNSRGQELLLVSGRTEPAFIRLDFVVESLIAAAGVLVGQAIVSYEIFTGKTLPRRGLVRQWRSAVLLAGGFSAAGGWTLARGWHPISGLVMAAALVTVFYALFSWRSYSERERYMDQLRPFVSGPRLYEDLLAVEGPEPDVDAPRRDAAGSFRALCESVLGTKVGYLAAVGPLSPLVGPALIYPQGADPGPLPLAEITGMVSTPQAMYVPISPERFGGAAWAVPLWSERGLIGLLLLGEKRDGGLYTQEEIEIARGTGERLVDMQASVALGQRLMGLQRQRLTESQVVDRRTRRVLHDDVLPRLHTAILGLSAASVHSDGSGNGHVAGDDALAILADAHRRISDLLRDMPSTVAPELTRLGLVGALKRAIDEEWAGAFDQVNWKIEPVAAQEVEHLPPLTAEVLFYAAREAIRNAARHGRQGDSARPLQLTITLARHNDVELLVEDDGVGVSALPPDEQRNGGSGQGLALHSTMMAVVGGSLSTESVPGQYTRVVLSLPAGQ